jgi:hypothetical protein
MMAAEKVLLQITHGEICAGVELQRNYVVNPAPVLRFTMGWHRARLENYYRRKGGKVEQVECSTS